MTMDFIINVVAGLFLLALGFVSQRFILRVRTRSTRSMWRQKDRAKTLVVAMTTHEGKYASSGIGTSLREATFLSQVIPVLTRLGISVSLSESTLDRATGITFNDVLVFGGPNANKLASEMLDTISSVFKGHGPERTGRWLEVFGTRYETTYVTKSEQVELDHGIIARFRSPYSADPRRIATIVAGCHSLGTAGAAQALSNEHLAKQVLGFSVDPACFIAVISAKAIGSEYAVTVKSAHALDDALSRP